MAKSSSKVVNTSSNEEVVTVNLQPLLMPMAIVLSTLIFTIGFVVGMDKLAKGISGEIEVSNNDDNDTVGDTGDTGNTAPTVVEEGKVSIDDDPYLGDKDNAKIAIVEFSDFQCPFCGRFYSDTHDQIVSEYVESGDAIFVYRDYPLSFHPQAEISAIASECVFEQEGNDGFWTYADKLFNLFNGGGTPTNEDLADMAEEVGADRGDFEECLENDDIKAEVTADMNDGSAAGISGTPGFIIGTLDEDGNVDGEIVSGAQPFSTFQAAIDRQLNK